MRRKVAKIGQSTLMISLPSKWAKANNVKKGDEVEVVEEEERLVVRNGKEFEPKLEQTTTDVSDKENMVHRIIAATYKAGYDEINITYSKPEELKRIQEKIESSLTGFDIIDYKQNKIRVKAISKLEPGEFETVFKRIFICIKDISADALKAIKNKGYEELKNIVMRDKSLDKYTDFCRRLLNKKIETKFRKPKSIYYIIEEIEIIGDMYKELSKEIADKKIKVSNDLISLLNEVNIFFGDFSELLFRFDLEKIKMFGVNQERLNKKIDQLYKKVDKKELKIFFLIIQIFNATFEMKSALLTEFV